MKQREVRQQFELMDRGDFGEHKPDVAVVVVAAAVTAATVPKVDMTSAGEKRAAEVRYFLPARL